MNINKNGEEKGFKAEKFREREGGGLEITVTRTILILTYGGLGGNEDRATLDETTPTVWTER